MSHSFDWRCDACERPNQHDFIDGQVPDRTLACSNCDHHQLGSAGGFGDDGQLLDPIEVCLACGSNRLYSQKDFNRTLGVAIVIVGAAFSPWTYGMSLVACMGLDYGLYYFVPEVTVCYGCDAIHRGFEHNPAHRAHDPLLAERFRREARQELGLEPADDEAAPEEG